MAKKIVNPEQVEKLLKPIPVPPPVIMRPQEFVDFIKAIESHPSAIPKVIKALIKYNTESYASIQKLSISLKNIHKELSHPKRPAAKAKVARKK